MSLISVLVAKELKQHPPQEMKPINVLLRPRRRKLEKAQDSGATGGCSSGDCEGEEQEDPSSSSLDDVHQVREAIADLNIQDINDQEKSGEEDLSVFRRQWQRELKSPDTHEEGDNLGDDESASEETSVCEAATNRRNVAQDCGEDELAAFRQQWQRELEATPSPQRETDNKEEDVEPTSDEERAKKYFLKGAELERSGKWYESIQHYKRAMTIMPDIERKLYESTKGTETPQEEVATVEETPVNTNTEEEDDDEAVEGEEVVARLLRIQARRGLHCVPELPTRSAHISVLPYEVMLVILRWVVSEELDAVSLERVGATCRALHIAARDPDLWRALCIRTWGIECGTPRGAGFASWRDMYIRRARLQLHGCYISKTTYLRHGENSFQDQFYRPWYLVDYYRYLRFFPEGVVLMWTTAEEPQSCVHQLRHRHTKPSLGIMSGHYRLIGDKVVIVIKKTSSEKKQTQTSNTRFRSRRKEVEQEQTQTFHMELELRSVRSRRNAMLSWRGYSVCSRRDQWTQFELTPRSFPPFAFSRVRAYSQETYAPL